MQSKKDQLEKALRRTKWMRDYAANQPDPDTKSVEDWNARVSLFERLIREEERTQ